MWSNLHSFVLQIILFVRVLVYLLLAMPPLSSQWWLCCSPWQILATPSGTCPPPSSGLILADLPRAPAFDTIKARIALRALPHLWFGLTAPSPLHLCQPSGHSLPPSPSAPPASSFSSSWPSVPSPASAAVHHRSARQRRAYDRSARWHRAWRTMAVFAARLRLRVLRRRRRLAVSRYLSVAAMASFYFARLRHLAYDRHLALRAGTRWCARPHREVAAYGSGVHARPRGAFDMGFRKVSERRNWPWSPKGLRGAAECASADVSAGTDFVFA